MYIKRLQKSKEDALYIVGLYQCIFLPSYIFKMAFNGAVPKKHGLSGVTLNCCCE